MTIEFDLALVLTIRSVLNTTCVLWRILSMLYWMVATQKGLWNNSGSAFGLLLAVVGLNGLTDWPIEHFHFNSQLVVIMEVLNQVLLYVLVFLVHNMREERAIPMSIRHRVCYALLVENAVAFSLTLNYVQTATLATTLLAQHFGFETEFVSSLHLIFFAICVMSTVSVEFVYLHKFRWTVAAYVPIQLWASKLYHQSAINGKIVCVLIALNALLVFIKLVPEKCNYYLTFSLKNNQDEGTDQRALKV